MKISRAATIPLEIAHRGTDGVLHGHSLTAEVWTESEVDLDIWRQQIAMVGVEIEGWIEETIGGRTFEDVALVFLERLPEACRVIVRLPTRGHLVELARS